jgi:hypothetical protein
MPNIAAFERDRVARMREKLDRLTRAHYPDPARRTLVVGHRAYEVVWDGSVAATRQEVVPPGVRLAPQRVCACGCGVPVSFRLRFASQACAGRGMRGLPVTERVRSFGGSPEVESPTSAQ